MFPVKRKRRPADEEELLLASWAVFREQFTTVEACVLSLQGMTELGGKLRSTCCFELQPEETFGERKYKCPKCKRLVWVTADSFFNGIKDPITWRGAIWLYEDGLSPTPADLQRLSGASYSTCWECCSKLNMVLVEHILDGLNPIESSFFQEIIFRRTRMTPAGKHPRTEQAEIEKASLEIADEEAIDKFTERELLILDQLSQEPIQFDILCEKTNIQSKDMSSFLMMLELSGTVQRLMGDRYVRSKKPTKISDVDNLSKELKVRIAAFKNFVQAKFQGIGRKYLQLYLAKYWCRLERESWHRGRLLNACLSRRKIRRKDLLNYVTPEYVFMSVA